MSISITRQESGFLLVSQVRVAQHREEVFDIFANAYNLEDMTPPTLHFEILTPDPIVMRAGLILDYRLRLRGIPFRWQSEITVWEPPIRFVDEQRSGPYLWWVHEHRFEDEGGQTLVTDRVNYDVFGGVIVNTLFVARDLKAIFDYRAKRLQARLRLNR